MKSLLLEKLKELKNDERAIAHKAYHKSVREHWGIPVPECTRIVRELTRGLKEEELLSLAKDLWETNIYDPMLCATKVLSLTRLKPSKPLWSLLLNFLKQVDGWALEDQLAHAAWKCILANESLLDQLEKWTEHSSFWMRRAALVYTLPFAKKGRDPERMLKWASGYVSDPEWFIQKAIGWWLRVLGEHNPKRVLAFVEAHQLKGVAKREATRKL